jgi:hypothetical protein
MKWIFTLTFALSFVLYLSTASFAQGKGGIPANHGVDHDRDFSHDTSHGRSEAREDRHEANFEARIEENSELKSKIQSLLPAGTDLKRAANGFKSEGQFIAALHVSKNLNIPFDQLKMKMTGSNAMSLGQAIHALKPNMTEKDAEKEADKAEKQARATQRTKPVVT